MFKQIAIVCLIVSLQTSAMNFTGAWQSVKNFGKSIVASIPQPTSYNPHVWFHDNYYKVMDNVFRSKTMSSDALKKHIQEDAIKSILILREIAPGDSWHQAEEKIATAAQVAIHHIELNAREFPSQEKIKQILSIFKNSKDAILIHCVAGVDRTGAISALRKLMENGTTLEQALAELSLKYGHHEWRFPHMKEFIKRIYALKEQHGSLDAAIDHYDAAEQLATYHPELLPIRAAKSAYRTAKETIQSHPYIATGIAAITVAALATYLYNRDSYNLAEEQRKAQEAFHRNDFNRVG